MSVVLLKSVKNDRFLLKSAKNNKMLLCFSLIFISNCSIDAKKYRYLIPIAKARFTYIMSIEQLCNV